MKSIHLDYPSRIKENRRPSPLALKQIEDLLRNLGEKGRDLLKHSLARRGKNGSKDHRPAYKEQMGQGPTTNYDHAVPKACWMFAKSSIS